MSETKYFKQDCKINLTRRQLLASISLTGTGLFLSSCRELHLFGFGKRTLKKDETVGEVTALEDLMREHGVLQRILFVYSEMADRLRKHPSGFRPELIWKAAVLFQSFGEEYHEKKLEEVYIFPEVKRRGGQTAAICDILIAQHRRGQILTGWLLTVTGNKKYGIDNPHAVISVLDSFVRMYRPHAALEDTVVFPAWKQAISPERLGEMGDKFEDIEHEQFGEDGFENAVKQVSDIENVLGINRLEQFTAPIHPKI